MAKTLYMVISNGLEEDECDADLVTKMSLELLVPGVSLPIGACDVGVKTQHPLHEHGGLAYL